MQAHSNGRVRTFTIGFDLAGWDESTDAAKVAAHLGTDHTEFKVTAAETLDVVPRLPAIYDEPFADSSQIPTFLVSRLAREHVKVCLSGDGGDEVFGGYNRYTWCEPIWERIRRVPHVARRAAARMVDALPPSTWDALMSRTGHVLPARLRVRNPGTKMGKLAEVLPVSSLAEMYLVLTSHWKQPNSIVIGSAQGESAAAGAGAGRPGRIGPAEQMMYSDTLTYLPDDILTKVDRASMAVSLEARVPMLDHRLVEWAWRLPLDLKIRDGEGKWLLRQVLYRHVPAALVDRPKMGFGLPIGDWLRGPLRGWAETLLDERRLRDDGYLEPGPIRRLWDEHQDGRRDWPFHLWDVLMFQAWLEAS
jgi:asparagine synthase (glutamine-hydrolysing)